MGKFDHQLGQAKKAHQANQPPTHTHLRKLKHQPNQDTWKPGRLQKNILIFDLHIGDTRALLKWQNLNWIILRDDGMDHGAWPHEQTQNK